MDRLVVLRGAAFALLAATPAALMNTLLAAQVPKPTGALNATLLIMLGGFGFGGAMAGREAGSMPLAHGVLTGLVAFVPVQAIGLLGRGGRGDPVSVGAVAFLLVAALIAACLGALIGRARRARTRT